MQSAFWWGSLEKISRDTETRHKMWDGLYRCCTTFRAGLACCLQHYARNRNSFFYVPQHARAY